MRISLDKRTFTVMPDREPPEIDDDFPPGEYVTITDTITNRTINSFYEYPRELNAGDMLPNFGFCDDLNALFQKVTGAISGDDEYRLLIEEYHGTLDQDGTPKKLTPFCSRECHIIWHSTITREIESSTCITTDDLRSECSHVQCRAIRDKWNSFLTTNPRPDQETCANCGVT
jgi:hypothetical protein